jgi:Rad3-related DNA helicase
MVEEAFVQTLNGLVADRQRIMANLDQSVRNIIERNPPKNIADLEKQLTATERQLIDANKVTPQTAESQAKTKQLMEGHHLIPCTVTNAVDFVSRYYKNIDCMENIVCLCPTCHRAVHFGDDRTKAEKVKAMYAKQAVKLREIGIAITEDELLALYKK